MNNLGLCELLLKRYANGYEYFSKAFEIYKTERNLNILGLLRNLGELYSQWEMYEQAVRFFEFILSENDRERTFGLGEEAALVLTVMRCVNMGGNIQGRKSAFQRAEKIVRRLGEGK